MTILTIYLKQALLTGGLWFRCHPNKALFGFEFCMFSLCLCGLSLYWPVSHLPKTCQKVDCVCTWCTVVEWHSIQDVFLPHTQCSQDRFWSNCNPDQDKKKNGSWTWMNDWQMMSPLKSLIAYLNCWTCVAGPENHDQQLKSAESPEGCMEF